MVLWSNLHLGYVFGLIAIWTWLISIFVRDAGAGVLLSEGPYWQFFVVSRPRFLLMALALLSPSITMTALTRAGPRI
jgi:hypothetical protein